MNNKPVKWTYERCKDEISKVKYYKEILGTSIYNAIKKNGWYELMTGLIRERSGPYTEQEVIDCALGYKTRNEFRLGSPGLYGAAKRLGIMSEATKHMGKSLVEKQYTKDEILESARRYTNQRDWLINEPSVFRCAQGYTKNKKGCDKKFWESCISHMEYVFKPNGYWTYERCKEVALRFKTYKEFREDDEFKTVLPIIRKRGWGDLIEHLDRRYKIKGYWTYENCKREALKYNSRSEFCNSKSGRAYQIINKNKWFELLSHMKRGMSLKERVVYVYEFVDNKRAYIGLTCNVHRRHNAHMGKEMQYGEVVSPVYKFMIESNEKPKFKILSKKPIKEHNAPKSEEYYIEKYKNGGWEMLNTARAGSLGGNRKIWTKEKLKFICESCNSFSELKQKIPTWAYYNIWKNGWGDLTSHLIVDVRREWTDDEAYKIAKDYVNITSLSKKYNGVAKYIRKRPKLREKLDLYWSKQ